MGKNHNKLDKYTKRILVIVREFFFHSTVSNVKWCEDDVTLPLKGIRFIWINAWDQRLVDQSREISTETQASRKKRIKEKNIDIEWEKQIQKK